ncbi:hypothetical protein FRC01_005787 [Tulasnella sp. 417]|nr:hypothetical protein FRC01_005787 [Tulasnella sp. 417]
MALNSRNQLSPEDPLNRPRALTSPSPISTLDLSPPDRPRSPASHRSTSPSIFSSPKRAFSPVSPHRKRDRLLAPFHASRRLPLHDAEDEDPVPYTEEELREIFEEEEIQRFLSAFHAHVGEVTLPSNGDDHIRSQQPKVVIVPAEDAKEVAKAGAAPSSAAVEPAPVSLAQEIKDSDEYESGSSDEEEEDETSGDSWVNVKSEPKTFSPEEALPSKKGHVHIQRPRPVWGSELAAEFIVPYFPQGRAIEARNRRGGKHDRFSISALRSAGQRIYLAIYPFYVPFLLKLWDLARWINWWKSARLCIVYWFLWWHNMLLPGFLFYLVYQLIKHRLLPYPTYDQLRARHQAAVLAESFGDAIVSTESHSGPWKSSEGYSGLGALSMGIANATAAAQSHAENIKVSNMMKIAMGAGKGALTGRFKKDKSTIDPEAKMSTLEDDRVLQGAAARHAGDWRRLAVLLMEEVADVHERAKNLFFWRRPESTSTYTMALFVIACVVTVTPVQILAKAVYGGLGFFFWFIIPVLCAMTRKQRSMIPPLFWDIPTDAEYAMEIIAQRVAKGESVVFDKKQIRNITEAYGARSKRDLVLKNRSRVSLNSAMSPSSPVVSPQAEAGLPSLHSESYADPIAHSGGTESINVLDTPSHRGETTTSPPTMTPLEIAGEYLGIISRTSADGSEVKSYSAHHKHIPGIITLSNLAIEFTPFLRHRARVQILLDRIRGVKRAGRRTLIIRFVDPVPSEKDEPGQIKTVENPESAEGPKVLVMAEREEKFTWVGQRDEVFARLVASKKNAWVPV